MLMIFHQPYQKIDSYIPKEQLPLPTAFTSEDVNMNAPRLYTDSFMVDVLSLSLYVFYMGCLSGRWGREITIFLSSVCL